MDHEDFRNIKLDYVSKYQQLKKKSAATALNIVFASAHIQTI
jgi:hypothetical protein